MALTADKVVVTLEAKAKQFNAAIENSRFRFVKDMAHIGLHARKAESDVNRVTRKIQYALGGVSAALLAREVLGYADAWTRASNRVAAAGKSIGSAGATLDAIYDIAIRSRTSLEAVAGAYSRIATSADALGISQQDVLALVETTTKALQVGGASAAEAASSITQLSQALGSGILQGDELKSLRENAIVLIQAIAKEFNTTVDGLRELGEKGQLNAGRVAKAILTAKKQIEASFATLRPTVEGAMTNVFTALTKYIGETDSSLGATQRLVAGLTVLAENFGFIADSTVKVASVIASYLVGSALGGLAVKLPLIFAGVRLLIGGFGAAAPAATVLATRLFGVAHASAAVAASSRIARFALAGMLAGPILGLIGVVAASLLYMANSADKGAEKAEELKQEMFRLGLISAETAGHVSDVAKSLDEITEGDRVQKLADIADAIERFKHGDVGFLQSLFGVDTPDVDTIKEFQKAAEDALKANLGSADSPLIKELIELSREFEDGKKSADEIIAQLEIFKKLKMDAPARELVRALERALALYKGFIKFHKRNSGITIEGRVLETDALRHRRAEEASMNQQDPDRQGIAFAKTIIDQTQFEKDLEKATDDIVKAVEEASLTISRGAAEILARQKLGKEITVQASSDAAKLIAEYESYRSESYPDYTMKAGKRVNSGYRVGYGSGEMTDASGAVSKVTAQSVTTIADATRDLVRRIAVFQADILKKVGADAYAKLTPEALASLTSVAYNYGNLPDRVVPAVQTGDMTAIAAAIEKLATDNGGINAGRRRKEAQNILGGGSDPAFAAIEAEEEARKGSLETSAREIELIKKRMELRSKDVYEQTKQLAIMEETQAREAEGIKITDEVRASIEAVAEARAQEALTEAEEEYRRASEGVLEYAKGLDELTLSQVEAQSMQFLINAAIEAGIPVTDELIAKMKLLAQEAANLAAVEDQTKTASDGLISAWDSMRSTANDVLSGFISDLRAGKSGAEALANAMNKIADKLIEIGINAVIAGLFGGQGTAGGGLLGGVLKLFTGGAAAGAGAIPTIGGGVPAALPGVPSIAAGRAANNNEPGRLIVDLSPNLIALQDRKLRRGMGVAVNESQKRVQKNMIGMIRTAQYREG